MSKSPRWFKVCQVMVIVAGIITAGSEVKANDNRDDSWDIALSLDIKGKRGWNTCSIFAEDLYKRLTSAGGEAHLVVYRWENDERFSQNHAIVVYRDAGGRYWAMDQQSEKPVWVPGSTPAEWIKFFGKNLRTDLISSRTEPNLAGCVARLDRAKSQKAEQLIVKAD